jgi:hypothetical protein
VAARGLIDVIDVIDHAWRHGDRTAASIAAAWLQLRLLHGAWLHGALPSYYYSIARGVGPCTCAIIMRAPLPPAIACLLPLLPCLTPATSAAPYTPTWPSLDSRTTPDWWQQAKFGISMHWGVYSVPAFSIPYSSHALGEWYGNYIGEAAKDRSPAHNPVQSFHDQTFGAGFEYSSFVDGFKAELYEPDDWAKLIKRAGAKWAMLTSKHHDGFELWPSPQASSNFPQFNNSWNSMVLGPKRDLLGELMGSLRKQGLRAGFYHSLFEWYRLCALRQLASATLHQLENPPWSVARTNC